MTIIIIRGLPGVGKTTIASKICKKLKGSLISVDKYKVNFGRKEFKKACLEAYDKSIEELELYAGKKEFVVVEEILYDSQFIKKLKNFAKKNNCKMIYFQLKRPMKKLLKIESHKSHRKRRIKNVYEDFINLQKKIDNQKIKNEIIIENSDIFTSVETILKTINKKMDE